MQRRDDRHFETRQEFDDVAAGLTAENPIFMLQGDNIEPCAVQEFGRLDILADGFFVNLKTHSRRIVVGAIRVRHGDDKGLKLWPRRRNRMMKIVSKRSDPASTRKMIPDERHAPKGSHLIVSGRPLFSAALS